MSESSRQLEGHEIENYHRILNYQYNNNFKFIQNLQLENSKDPFGVEWTAKEKEFILTKLLPRHSRFRPDAIAEDLKSGKTEEDVAIYLDCLEYEYQNTSEERLKASDAPMAYEMSGNWLKLEERFSDFLSYYEKRVRERHLKLLNESNNTVSEIEKNDEKILNNTQKIKLNDLSKINLNYPSTESSDIKDEMTRNEWLRLRKRRNTLAHRLRAKGTPQIEINRQLEMVSSASRSIDYNPRKRKRNYIDENNKNDSQGFLKSMNIDLEDIKNSYLDIFNGDMLTEISKVNYKTETNLNKKKKVILLQTMMDLRDLLISNVLMPLMGCISNIVNSRQHTLNSEYAPDLLAEVKSGDVDAAIAMVIGTLRSKETDDRERLKWLSWKENKEKVLKIKKNHKKRKVDESEDQINNKDDQSLLLPYKAQQWISKSDEVYDHHLEIGRLLDNLETFSSIQSQPILPLNITTLPYRTFVESFRDLITELDTEELFEEKARMYDKLYESLLFNEILSSNRDEKIKNAKRIRKQHSKGIKSIAKIIEDNDDIKVGEIDEVDSDLDSEDGLDEPPSQKRDFINDNRNADWIDFDV